MQIVQDTILRHLGKVLHAYVDDVTDEPVPRRWVDLILYLDEQERKSAKLAQPAAGGGLTS
jgi:hypothetical protein